MVQNGQCWGPSGGKLAVSAVSGEVVLQLCGHTGFRLYPYLVGSCAACFTASMLVEEDNSFALSAWLAGLPPLLPPFLLGLPGTRVVVM